MIQTAVKEFAPYQPSLDMKELGFDEPCFGYYIETGEWIPASYSQKGTIYPSNSDLMKEWVSAPLYQQAFRFFREKYGLFVAPSVISYENDPYLWFFEINSTVLLFGTDLGETSDFKTYEEAELACLIKLIEIVKNK